MCIGAKSEFSEDENNHQDVVDDEDTLELPRIQEEKKQSKKPKKSKESKCKNQLIFIEKMKNHNLSEDSDNEVFQDCFNQISSINETIDGVVQEPSINGGNFMAEVENCPSHKDPNKKTTLPKLPSSKER